MLTTDTFTLEPSQPTDRYQENWNKLREKTFNLILQRVETSEIDWYRDYWISSSQLFFENTEIGHPYNVNIFPKGLLGEVLFLEACSGNGIHCIPTEGNEDAWGADFKIENGQNTRYFDVSLNCSAGGLQKKTSSESFPTLFLPWYSNVRSLFEYKPNRYDLSYAEKYIRGEFSGSEFLKHVIGFNYQILDYLLRYVWRGDKYNYKLFGHKEMKTNRCGITYVNDYQSLLLFLRECL